MLKPKIGITIGDFNGIGPEVILKALMDKRITNICTPIIYGSGKILTRYKRILDMEGFSYHQFNQNSYLNDKKVNVINCWQEHHEIDPGRPTEVSGKSAFQALQKAVKDLKAGHLDGVVTAPISKENIQSEEFNFPGHTEYFTKEFEAEDSLMMMCSEDLKVGVVTAHIPLAKVPETITKQLVIRKIRLMYHSLKHDFGLQKPRIAVLGLNPHAGENGLLGDEEIKEIIPAVIELKKKGLLVFGPFPADGFFGSSDLTKFDGVLAMYHDQGLGPFKTLAFDKGVNYTAGLSIVRTSPDHGTAFSLAGKGVASEKSMLEAIFMAVDIARNRADKTEKKLRSNPDPKYPV